MYINLLIFSPSVTLFKLRRMHTEELITSLGIIIRKQFSVFHARFGPFTHKTAFRIYSAIPDPVCVYMYIVRSILFRFHQIYVFFDCFVKKRYRFVQYLKIPVFQFFFAFGTIRKYNDLISDRKLFIV